MALLRCAAVLFPVLFLWSCGNSSPSRQTSQVGAAGGVIAVTTGPLAGTALSVPAMAVPDGTQITIDESAPEPLAGYEVVGPGANFMAAGVELALPASARLVFDPALLPMGAVAADLAVIRQNSQGRRVTLVPTAVDLAGGTADVAVEQFASYWVALETLDLAFVLANYLPLIDGDRYEFDNGVVASIDLTASEPNLEGLLVARLSFSDGVDYAGLYLERDLATTLLYGEFSSALGNQAVVLPPPVVLPATAEIGDQFAITGQATVFAPYGSPFPTDVANLRVTVAIVTQGRLDTPLGRFENVLELRITIERTDSNLDVETTVDRWWLARGIGPVQIELEDVGVTRRGGLVGGTVGGVVIGGV